MVTNSVLANGPFNDTMEGFVDNCVIYKRSDQKGAVGSGAQHQTL
jgi:hypothetical protein